MPRPGSASYFSISKKWHSHDSMLKQNIRVLATAAPKLIFDKNKLAWIRLEDHQYPRTASWLPE